MIIDRIYKTNLMPKGRKCRSKNSTRHFYISLNLSYKKVKIKNGSSKL